ncbi:MAG: hypothetical protein ACR2K6_08675 [Solirubrobacterales bacterium]
MAGAQIQRGFTLLAGVIVLIALIAFPIVLVAGGGWWSFAFVIVAIFWAIIYVASKRHGEATRARIAAGRQQGRRADDQRA